jgi:hypothetical protein
MGEYLERLADFVCPSCLTDLMFWRGVFMTIVVGWLAGHVLSFIGRAWALIQQFFAPSKSPATQSGPSGADRMMGCGEGVTALILAALIAIVLIAILVYAAL